MTSELAEKVDAAMRVRWIDLFPWLSEQTDDPGMWSAEIAGSTVERRTQRCQQIASLALNQLSHWSVGQLFPRLDPTIDLVTATIPTRARNALTKRGLRTAGDLAPHLVSELLGWRNLGVGSVAATLESLAQLAYAEQRAEVAKVLPSPAPSDGILPRWLVDAVDDLTVIAEWLAATGNPTAAVLSTDIGQHTPDRVAQARTRLHRLGADRVIGGDATGDAATLLDDVLGTLDQRTLEIAVARIFAERPSTLAEVGEQHGITRERVRQISEKVFSHLRAEISKDETLEAIRATARVLAAGVRPLSELVASMPALGNTVPRAGVPAWQVLSRLDEEYEIAEGWCVSPTMSEAQERTKTDLLAMADPHGVARLIELDIMRCLDGAQHVAHTKRWLEHCGYTVIDDFVLTRAGGIPDLAASFLAIAGEPLTLDQIREQLPKARAERSVGNAMAEDGRFVRVDVHSWSLREWGLAPYRGIRHAISAELDTVGGSIELKALIDTITGQYDVTANSVAAYAAGAPFVTKAGVVSVRTTKQEPTKSPQQTRRLFRWPHGWGYRVRVNGELLRGSGFPASVGLASAIGLEPEQKLHLESRLGEHSISWMALQPVVGSIRRFLLDLNLSFGDEVLLSFGDDGTFDVLPCRNPVGVNAFDALAMIGSGPVGDEGEARARFATAVGLTADTPWPEVRAAYAARGDNDVAALLPGGESEDESGEPTDPQPELRGTDEPL